MKLYKLTNEKHQTYNNMQWGPGVTQTATGDRLELCSDGLIHAYEDPLLAVLLNPIHSSFEHPVLWEAESDCDVVRDGQLKCGVRTLTTVRVIELPVVTTEQRVRFAILCALRFCEDTTFVTWANRWLSGEDRTAESAWAWTTARAAARAAAAWAAKSAAAREAAESAAWAAESAWAAAWAAEAAVSVLPEIDLIEIAREAVGYQKESE